MTPILLGPFVKKLQPKVGLAGCDILNAYFVVEAISKIKCSDESSKNLLIFYILIEHNKYCIVLSDI